MKNKVIDDVLLSLKYRFNDEELSTIRNHLLVAFQGFDVTPIKYEVTTFAYNDDKLIQMFLVAKKIDGLSDKTLAAYGKEIKRNLHRYINKSVLEFTKDDVRVHFARRMMDNPEMKKTTINNERRYFSTFFKWLVDNDYMEKNPMSAIKNVKVDKVIKQPLSEEDIEKMRDYLAQKENSAKTKKEQLMACRNSAIFEFLLSTGCRVSELTGAKLKDLNLHDHEIKVFGKGAKERICYLNAKSIMRLEKYLNLRNDDNPYLFIRVNKSDEERLHKSGVEIMIRELGRSCGIEKVHPHKFRRTAATTALNKGMPIEEVQVMLGHEQLDTTMIYANVKVKNVKASHEKYM